MQQLKKRSTTIHEDVRRMLGISRDIYAFCAYVHYRCADSRQKRSGWCCDNKQDISDFVGVTRPGLYKMAERLQEIGLIEISNSGDYRATPKWVDSETNCKQSLQNSPANTVNKVDKKCKQSLQNGAKNVNKVDNDTLYRELDIKLEGERNTPAPNPSNLKEEKKENGLVAPGREKSTADIIFETAAEYGIEAEIPPSKKVAPKKDSPKICVTCAGVGSTHGWDGPEICEDCGGNGNESAQFDVTAIASPTRLPGVTLVEAAPKPIQPWERPLPGSPKELKNVLLRYSEENPENWRDNVLESGRATGMTKEKIDEYLTDFCQWQFQQDSTKGRLSQYTAGFSLWLKRQPRFEVMNAPKEGSQTRNSQQTPPPNYQTQTRH